MTSCDLIPNTCILESSKLAEKNSFINYVMNPDNDLSI